MALSCVSDTHHESQVTLTLFLAILSLLFVCIAMYSLCVLLVYTCGSQNGADLPSLPTAAYCAMSGIVVVKVEAQQLAPHKLGSTILQDTATVKAQT